MSFFEHNDENKITVNKVNGQTVDQKIVEAANPAREKIYAAVGHLVKRKWKIAALILIFIVAASWTIIVKGYFIIKDQKNTIDKKLNCPVCVEKKCEVCPVCPVTTSETTGTNTNSAPTAAASTPRTTTSTRRSTSVNNSATTTQPTTTTTEPTEEVLTPPAPPAD